MTNIRHPTFTGRQPVAGVWFPEHWLAHDRYREDVFALWHPGADLYRFPTGVLLRFPHDLLTFCEALPAWPLCRVAGILSSAPLTDQERAALPRADLWLVRGARVTPLNLADAEPLDPSTWIDVSGYPLSDTFQEAKPKHSFNLPPSNKRSLRDVLGNVVPTPSEEQAKFLTRASAAQPAEGIAAQALSATRFLARSITETLRLRLASQGVSQAQAKARIPARGAGTAAPQTWRQWAERLALLTQVSRLIGWRQAAYLRKMLALFEDSDLQEALRHAIPLGDGTDSLGSAFGIPGARRDLTLSANRRQGTSIGFGAQLDAHLRALYRQAFQRLDRQGRIDEAVFVLAELLQARQEALDYLVQHERTAQAADLALSWDFPPDTIVRLLVMSGDWERALLIARRDNAFGSAVLMLQKQRPDLAQRLRKDWAEALVAKGEWLAAVGAIWPVKQAREQAAEWLRLAEAAGGTLAARSLVQRAVLLADTLDCHADRMTALRDEPHRHEARSELALALFSIKESSAATAGLASAIFPRLLADRLAGDNRLSKIELEKIAKETGDPLLRADLPPLVLPDLPRPAPLARAVSPMRWTAPARGLQSISDVGALPDQCYALAQGEAGIAIFNPGAKELQRYAVAADRLVIADSGRVLLAMAKRDTVWRVSRIDIVSHQVKDLGVLPLDHSADTFDGIGWTVVSDGRLLVLDTTQSVREVMWHVSDLPGPVSLLTRTETHENIVIDAASGLELWRYQLPGRRLVQRDALPDPGQEEGITLIHPNGSPLRILLRVAAEEQTLGLSWNAGPAVLAATVPLPDLNNGIRARVMEEWLIAGMRYPDHFSWFLINLHSGAMGGQVIWSHPSNPRLRIAGHEALFFDDAGRILTISTADGTARETVIV